jgi:hypothetical protein
VRCGVCDRPAAYSFANAAGGRDPRCLRHALLDPRVRDRAVRVALVVGVVLFAVTQLDVVLRGEISALVVAKIALTFVVPYLVSSYSALQVNRLAPS